VYKLLVECNYTMPFKSRVLCPISFEGVMPYALDFPANDIGSHENVCHFVEYALSDYMPYMGVDCIYVAQITCCSCQYARARYASEQLVLHASL
jgi:hypothetical protein